MSDFPKSVRGRLGQTSPPLEHPEADTLNAYSEGVLGAAERERMVAHLAVCSRCREIVSLVAPPLEALQVLETGNRKLETRPWLRFPVLRWGVAAAAGAIVISAVLLHRPADLVRPAASPMRTETPPSAPPVQPNPPEPVVTMQQRARAEQADSVGLAAELAAKSKSMPAGKPSEQVAQAAREPAMTADRSYTRRSPIISTSNVERTHGPAAPSQQMLNSWQYNQNSVSQDQLAKAGPAPAPVVGGVLSNAVAPTKQEESPQVPLGTVSVAAAAPARSDVKAAKHGDLKTADAKAARELQLDNAPSPPQHAETGRVGDPGVTGQSAAGFQNAYAMRASQVSGSISWSISPDGDLIRHEDSGKQVVSLAGVNFRAVATVGADVWAGSKGGRLYHSVDGGQTWKQTPFPAAQDIVSIAFTNARNGTIVTSTGEQYATSDGGQTWRRQAE